MNPTREHKLRTAIRHTQTDITVVLENIFDPMNISAVLRSCDAIGIREVFVIYTKPYLDKRGLVLGKRTSGGTFKWIDVYVFEDLQECFKRVRERYGRVLATHLGEHSQSLYDLDLSMPTALLFGNEDEGVSEEARALCDGNFVIPMAGFAESLNISVACAVTLFEARRQRAEKGRYDQHPMLNTAQQEEMYQRWNAMLKERAQQNHGIQVTSDTAPLLPVYVERAPHLPPLNFQAVPVTKFDL